MSSLAKKRLVANSDAAWQTLVELVVEALETCIREGLWRPGRGLVGLEDTLKETMRRAKKEQ